MIVKSTYRHGAVRRRMLKTSDWTVLRRAQCPVLLVKQEHATPLRCVLAALDIGAEDDAHRPQSSRSRDNWPAAPLIACCMWSAPARPSSVMRKVCVSRVAPVWTPSSPTPWWRRRKTPSSIARRWLPPTWSSSAVSRDGLGALTSGNTAERALDHLDTDLLVVTLRRTEAYHAPHHGHSQRPA